MIAPIDPAELSGFLDGELTRERAAQIEAALGSDPELAAAFTALRDADAAWRSAASEARFQPRVQFAPRRSAAAQIARALVVGLALAALSLLPWVFSAPQLTLLPHLGALAIALVWAAKMAGRVEPLQPR
jgi:anti-sigma factor RsiW